MEDIHKSFGARQLVGKACVPILTRKRPCGSMHHKPSALPSVAVIVCFRHSVGTAQKRRCNHLYGLLVVRHTPLELASARKPLEVAARQLFAVHIVYEVGYLVGESRDIHVTIRVLEQLPERKAREILLAEH